MARPSTISTEHILDVARREFLARGYGVSTAHIALKAGISEGTIYKRFATKDALFHASMGLPDTGFVDDWAALVGTGTPEANLRFMGARMLTTYRELLPCLMMLWSSSNADPMEAMKHNPEPPPVKVLLAVRNYVAGEVELGRLQPGGRLDLLTQLPKPAWIGILLLFIGVWIARIMGELGGFPNPLFEPEQSLLFGGQWPES